MHAGYRLVPPRCAVIRLHRSRRAQRRSTLASSFRPLRPTPCQRRVWLDCCTHGRVRPAHPRFAGLLMADLASGRLFLCACCSAQVLVCSRCDRGQRDCADCACKIRKTRQAQAARRYQQGHAGRIKHALRTCRWRSRVRAAKQIVTHQGSQSAPPDDSLSAPVSTQPEPSVQPCTTSFEPAFSSLLTVGLESSLSTATAVATTVTTLPLLPTWHCHWCATQCAAHVRQGFLRHGDSP